MQGLSTITKRICLTLIAAIIIAVCISPVSALEHPVISKLGNINPLAKKSVMTEDFGFTVKAYPYRFQRRENVIDIDVTYRYKAGITKPEYPNFIGIQNEIKDYIQNYPDKYQYWEILNKDIATMLAENYPVLENIEVDLTIYPTTEFPIKRHSLVSIQHSN